MKTNYLGCIIVTLLLFVSENKAQETIWSDDFETDKGWTLTGEFERGTPSGGAGDHGNANPTSAYSGTNAIGTDLDGAYPDDLVDREFLATSPIIDCSGYVSVQLDFQRWLNVESSSYDHAYIEVSTNGTNWNVVWENGTTTEDDNSWTSQSIDLSAYADDNANVQIRYALGSTDGSWYYSGWNIDDVKITGDLKPVIGDYQASAQTGVWSDRTNWERWDGDSWETPTVLEGYPGENSSPAKVEISNRRIITLDVSPANQIGYLSIPGGNQDSYIDIQGNNALVVSGLTFINSTNRNDEKGIRVNDGTFSTGSLELQSNDYNTRDAYILINDGTVNVDGDITMNNTAARTFIRFDGNGTLNIGGSITGGAITSDNDGTVAASGTVGFNGSGAQQNINSYYQFFNIEFSNSADKYLASNIDVLGTANILSNLYCVDYVIGGTGTFSLANAATLGIGHASGITTAGNADGNIQTNIRNYDAGANYLYNGSSTQITGNGLPAIINELQIDNSANVSLSASVAVSNDLNLLNGNLLIGDYDLTINDGATLSGTFDNTHMIVCGGSGAVKKQATSIASFNMTLPIGTGTDYTPMTISNMNGSVTGTGEIGIKMVNATAPEASAIDLLRYWELSEANITLTSADIEFNYLDTDVSGEEADYELKRYDSAGGTWEDPANPAINTTTNKLTTTGTDVIEGVWTARGSSEAWYTLKTGNWNDPSVWTLDPSGAIYNNPTNYYPQGATDQVVIKNSREITMNVDNIACNFLTVEGVLYLEETSGHSFNKILGDGRVYMKADNFPTGDATHFVSKNQGEGTVIYQGGGYTISNDQTFFDMEVNLSGSEQIVTLLGDLTINNNLTVTQGQIKINDDVSTDIITINVSGNVEVLGSGALIVGQGNTIGSYSIAGTLPAIGQYHSIYHQFIVNGNFTNRGTVRFTNETAPQYNTLTTTGGVTLRFEGANDNSLSLFNTTNLNNLVIDKGIDNTYVLEVYADNTDYFRLFGANTLARIETSPFSVENPEVRKSLWIKNGTLKLTGSIHIPTLSEASASKGDFAIGQTARLWLAGANVTVYSTASAQSQIPGFEGDASSVRSSSGSQALALIGELKVEDGLFGTRNSAGIAYWPSSNAILEVNGGIVNIAQFRSTGTASGRASYIQTGGQVIVRGNQTESGEISSSHAIFGLSSADDVFTMSGGEILIHDDSGYTYDLYIPSTTDNANVTGGTIRFYYNGAADKSYDMYVVPPVYNLTIDHERTDRNHTVVLNTALTVLNDLTINGSGFLDHQGNSVTVGRNFTIADNAYDHGYSTADDNTLTFNGTEDATFYIGHPTLDSYELNINNLTINKPVGKSLLIESSAEKKAPYVEANAPSDLWYARIIQVENELRVESGTFDQGDQAIRLYGPMYVGADGVCGVYEHGTTHKDALIMIKDVVSITTENGSVLGNIKMNPSPADRIFDLTSDVVIKRISYHHGRMNLGAYNLKVDYIHEGGTLNPYNVTSGNATDEMFLTDGGASNGGLSVLITGNSTYSFPIGVTGKYTPAELTITNFSDDGYVTVRPVDGELKTTDLTGGNLLDYYWRVSHSDFTTLPTAQYNFTYDGSDDLAGDEANFYPGKVLDENPYTRSYENSLGNVNTSNNIITFNDTKTTSGGSEQSNTQNGFTLENANYSAGVANRFTGSVRVFYTKYRGSDAYQAKWDENSSWTFGANASYGKHDSRQAEAGDIPGNGDVAVIGWIPWDDQASLSSSYGLPHGVCVDSGDDITCAEIVFDQMTDDSGNPVPRAYRYNFQFRPAICINGTGQLSAEMVRGEGMFWNRHSDPDMSTMDLGEFAANDSSYVLYEFSDPGSGNVRELTNTPDELPNLLVASPGWGSYDRDVSFTKNIVTNGNLEVLGDANILLTNDADGDLTIGRDFFMFMRGSSGGGAELAYQNTGTARTVTIGRDIIMDNSNNTIQVRGTGGAMLDHQLRVNRHISQTESGDGLDLWTSNSAEHVTLYLEGSENMTFDVEDATSTADLYRIVVNKGVDQSVTANFVSDFNLNGATDGDPKALELTSGTLILDNAGIDIDLTTGNAHFNLPSTSALIIKNGLVNAEGNSGIELDGLLRIEGGTLDMDGGDNPIIYSASGNALIEVAGGNLIVGGQVRRGTVSDVGVLGYNQTAGTVRIGTGSATVNNRGVFEILGSGSNFTHAGGSLYIENAQTTPTVAALLLDPETSSVGSASTIMIGGTSTNASQILGINSSIGLANLTVDNSSNNNPIASLSVKGLSLSGAFQIDALAEFDAAGLDLSVGGNFVNNGTFTHNSNTTYLNGASRQTISGDVNFFDLEKSGTHELVLHASGANLDIDNNLVFAGGTLTDNGNQIEIQRNISFDGEHQNTSGKGIVVNGTIAQTLSGSGIFDVLTINNSAGVDVPLGNQLTIKKNLRLEDGVFNIDKNLLMLNSGSTIEAVNPFSASNMIQTNISFTDNGVRKYFNTTPKTFVYPMGSGGKYTPVTIRIDSNTSSTGYITVKAADEYHPSAIDPANVLDYHWILKSEDITGFTGEIRMKYDAGDVNVSGANTIDDYITARLLADGSGDWNKDLGTIDQGNKELVFDLTTTITSSEITGDYTAGVDPAIPDRVPTYISITDGPWNQASTWDTYPTAGGAVPAGGPRGSIVIVDVGTNVSVTADAVSSYQTTINGTLAIGSTYAHRLGDVDGTGKFSAETGVMPAGVYDSFISSSGGTLEYTGSTDYSMLGDLTSVNNLIFAGTNERRLPNHNLTILGDLQINGASVVNNNDKNLILKKDFIFDAGAFDSGDNGARVVFSGTSLQSIRGTSALTGTNGIDYFEINNTNGVAINIDVDIDNYLNLSSGIIFNNNDKNLVVKSNLASAIIGGGATSYVQGPLTKLVNNGDSFSFPVGDADRLGDVLISSTITSGADYWIAEYFNNSPANESKDPTSVAGDVQFVSQNEYWRIQGPASGQAKVKLRWDNLSGVTPDANFRVVEWKSTSDWNEVSIDTPAGDNSAGTVESASRISYNEFAAEGNYFTFGSISIPAYTWLGTGSDGDWFNTANWQGGVLPSAGTNITLNDAGNAPFIPNDALVAQVNDLTIDHSSGLTMQPGSQLTVNGTLITNDRLYVENTNANPSSLITNGTVNGDVSIKWTYDNLRWWFIGHAISNAVMTSYEALRPVNDYAMYDYQDGDSYYKVSANAGTYDLAAQNELKGFLFKVRDTGAEVTHVGELNDNAVYQRQLQDGWQIIANPYASYYKLPKQTRAGADFEHTTGTVYVTVSTRNSDKTFETFNTISGLASPETFTNGIVAPSQSFYVKTDDGKAGQLVYMREGNRIHDVNKVTLKSAPNTDSDVLRIKLSNGRLEDEAVIALRENGKMIYTRMDSEQRFVDGNDLSYIYSMVDGNKAVINVVPKEMQDKTVQLGIKSKEGNHTIRIEGINTLTDQYDFELEDKAVGVKVPLDANSEYAFTAEEVENNDRFVLHFGKTEVPTDIGDGTDEEQDKVQVYIQNKSTLIVNCGWIGEKQVMLYTLKGRMVENDEFKAEDYTKDLNLKPGIYVVKIIGDKNQFEQKIFVNK